MISTFQCANQSSTMFFPLLVAAFLNAQSYALTTAVSCSSTTALAKNFVVTISNDMPLKGQNVTTTFDFDLDVPVMGGIAKYAASLNGFPYTSQANLCGETAKTNDPCPLLPGHHHEVSTSTNTVSGKLITMITWLNEAGAEILCAKITTKTL